MMNKNEVEQVVDEAVGSIKEEQSWLLTYADMMTLLFAFFVLLFSLSSPDPVKISKMQDGMGDQPKLKSFNAVTEDFEERAKLICFLAEMELDRLGPKVQPPEFPNEDRSFNDREIDWLLNYECYHVGIVSKEDLESMGNSLKKTYEILKKSGDINTLKLEDNSWGIMALASILSMFGSRDDRNDQRVEIAGNTGLRKYR